MTKLLLMTIVLAAMGDVTVHAAPMIKKEVKSSTIKEVKEQKVKRVVESKPKKRRTFKSIMAKSVGFVASSAVMGGMSDR